MDAGEVKYLIRSLWPMYWRQLNLGAIARFTLIGDLKGEKRKAMEHKAYFSIEAFKKEFLERTKSSVAEVYGSLSFVKPTEPNALTVCEKGGGWTPVKYVFAFDIDSDENDLSNLRPVYEAYEILKSWGVEPTIKLSGGGIHMTFLPRIDFDAKVLEELPKANQFLASLIERKLGGKIKFCRKIYDLTHLFRLTLSWHGGRELFAIPIKPEMLLNHNIEDLRNLGKDLDYVRKVKDERLRLFGGVSDEAKFITILDLALPRGYDLKVKAVVVKEGRKDVKVSSGWHVAEDPILGRFEYDGRLEGYGWVKALVEKSCLLVDGRNTMCWLILPEAVVKGIITEEEAKEYIRKSVEAYPDPETPVEHYIRKFEYELGRQRRREYGLPTWRSLIIERKKIPNAREWSNEPIDEYYIHVKYPILLALHQKSLVKLTKEQLTTLKQKIEGERWKLLQI
ncbi:MAG: hypothetical protein B7O98_02725 [Zestosphaera tikiterensis]|uniref:DNA primase noncatalytic subunit PriX n=1 Tax=Zestosphaera tikiterensis TaxID=1973259 RepID=A0A2R7Y753_9CREN|nr:MAG: hypothetical protein B7O98_02725 [Zestosphaera tikiterensis]